MIWIFPLGVGFALGWYARQGVYKLEQSTPLGTDFLALPALGADRNAPAWYSFEVREAKRIGDPQRHKKFLGPKLLPRDRVVSVELATQRKLQGLKLSHVTVRAWRWDSRIGWQPPGSWEHYA